jgi:hypothetical protein
MTKKPRMPGEAVGMARAIIGEKWGLGRPLRRSELARVLRYQGANGSATIAAYETGAARVPAVVSLALDLLCLTNGPPDGPDSLKPAKAKNPKPRLVVIDDEA